MEQRPKSIWPWRNSPSSKALGIISYLLKSFYKELFILTVNRQNCWKKLINKHWRTELVWIHSWILRSLQFMIKLLLHRDTISWIASCNILLIIPMTVANRLQFRTRKLSEHSSTKSTSICSNHFKTQFIIWTSWPLSICRESWTWLKETFSMEALALKTCSSTESVETLVEFGSVAAVHIQVEELWEPLESKLPKGCSRRKLFDWWLIGWLSSESITFLNDHIYLLNFVICIKQLKSFVLPLNL